MTTIKHYLQLAPLLGLAGALLSPSESLSGAPKVILYGTTWCGLSKRAQA